MTADQGLDRRFLIGTQQPSAAHSQARRAVAQARLTRDPPPLAGVEHPGAAQPNLPANRLIT
jgi:hypothetical protein